MRPADAHRNSNSLHAATKLNAVRQIVGLIAQLTVFAHLNSPVSPLGTLPAPSTLAQYSVRTPAGAHDRPRSEDVHRTESVLRHNSILPTTKRLRHLAATGLPDPPSASPRFALSRLSPTPSPLLPPSFSCSHGLTASPRPAHYHREADAINGLVDPRPSIPGLLPDPCSPHAPAMVPLCGCPQAPSRQNRVGAPRLSSSTPRHGYPRSLRVRVASIRPVFRYFAAARPEGRAAFDGRSVGGD